MNKTEFLTQMNRLKLNYGEKFYSEERQAVIFKEIYQMSNQWLVSAVDSLIGSELYAPLLPKFLEKMAIARETGREKEKAENRDFFGGPSGREGLSTLSQEDIGTIMGCFYDRQKGKITQAEFDAMNQGLNKVMDYNKPCKCSECWDTGAGFEKDGAVTKCECRKTEVAKIIAVVRKHG